MNDTPTPPARGGRLGFTTADGTVVLDLPLPLPEMSAQSLHALSDQLAQLAIERQRLDQAHIDRSAELLPPASSAAAEG